MFKIENNNIYMTKEETLKIKLESDSDFFNANQTLTFSIMKKGDTTTVYYQGTFLISDDYIDSKNYILTIPSSATSDDTQFPSKSSGFEVYWYEIKITTASTQEGEQYIIMGYDTAGPKYLYMYPKAV